MNLRKFRLKIGLICIITVLVIGYSTTPGYSYGELITDIEIQPPNPTNQDPIEIIISGKWGTPCFDIASSISTYWNSIRIDVTVDQLSGFCLQVITPWEIMESIGTIKADTYNIEVYLNGGLYYVATTFFVVISLEEFVTRLYELYLSRPPDPAGLKRWVDGLSDESLTGGDVAYGFVFSPEFTSKNPTNEEYLLILYEAFFNRQPDLAGWQGWLDALNKGASREDVLTGFIFATEFNELCREYGIVPNPVAGFVTRFYNLCLKRDPDIAGLDGWVASLLSGENVGADVAEGFIFSPEFTKTVITEEEYIAILYKAFFDRDPDPTGLQGWLDAIAAGKTREEVLDGFIYSDEFWQLCEKYGITAFR